MSEPRGAGALDAILVHAGKSAGWETRVLAQPAGVGERDLSGRWDTVRVLLWNPPHGFGAPDLSFGELANGGWDAEWRSDEADSAALTGRVIAIAQNRIAMKSDDYNGALVGLRDYQVDQPAESATSRLNLLCERTNWATALATSQGLGIEPGGEVATRALPNLGDFGRTSWHSASSISVHLALVTSDGYLLLTRRTAEAQFGAGRLNNAVNGAVELGCVAPLRQGDFDDHGMVSLAHAVIREAHEEVGPHLDLKTENLVARNLGYYRDGEQANPFVIFEARVDSSFDDVVHRAFSHMSCPKGSPEASGEYYGLPLHESRAEEVVRWCKRRCRELHGPALVTVLLTLGHFASSRELLRMWNREAELSEESILGRSVFDE